MSSLKDDARMKRKLGGNPAAVAFVSPFASNNDIDMANNIDSNNNTDSNSNSVSDGESDVAIDNHITDDSNSDNNGDIVVDNKNDVDSNSNNNIASNDDNKSTNDNDVYDEVATAQEPTMSTIDVLLDGSKKTPPKVFKGFYLDPDVARVLDRLAKKQGKGIQSQVVNEALRIVFVSKGLI